MYIRTFLDHGEVIFHNQSIESMHPMDQLQCLTSLVVSGCWQGSTHSKVYADLGWESFENSRSFHRLSLYYKIMNT